MCKQVKLSAFRVNLASPPPKKGSVTQLVENPNLNDPHSRSLGGGGRGQVRKASLHGLQLSLSHCSFFVPQPTPVRIRAQPQGRWACSCTNSLQPSELEVVLLLYNATKASEKSLPPPPACPQAETALQGFLKEDSCNLHPVLGSLPCKSFLLFK